jgi:hypothetical protein
MYSSTNDNYLDQPAKKRKKSDFNTMNQELFFNSAECIETFSTQWTIVFSKFQVCDHSQTTPRTVNQLQHDSAEDDLIEFLLDFSCACLTLLEFISESCRL